MLIPLHVSASDFHYLSALSKSGDVEYISRNFPPFFMIITTSILRLFSESL
jgi:hypothetical protein